MEWQFEERADLRHPTGALNWPDLMMAQGDHLAHSWCVHVVQDDVPVDLTGYTVTAYFDRGDGKTVVVVGTANGNDAIITMPQSCYVCSGYLVGIMRATKDGHVLTLAAGRWVVRRGPGDELVDPGHVVPSLDDLLARISDMETATAAARSATSNANTAASEARATSANAAREAMDTANNAANEVTRIANDAAASVRQTADAAAAYARQTADQAASSVDGKIAASVAELHATSLFVDSDGLFYVEKEEG